MDRWSVQAKTWHTSERTPLFYISMNCANKLYIMWTTGFIIFRTTGTLGRKILPHIWRRRAFYSKKQKLFWKGGRRRCDRVCGIWHFIWMIFGCFEANSVNRDFVNSKIDPYECAFSVSKQQVFWQIVAIFRPLWLFSVFSPPFWRESSRECTLVHRFRPPHYSTSALWFIS